MLDPAYVRDHVDDVRTGLRNRGLDAEAILRAVRRARREAPRADPRSRESEARAERRRARRSRARRSRGSIRRRSSPRTRRAASEIKQLEAELDEVEQQRNDLLDDGARICRTRACRWGSPPRTTSRCGVTATPRAVRLRAEAALGPRPGARHSRLRARRADVGRALLGADGRRRAAGARAHQLHARPAHARARLHRSRAAVSRERGRAARHGQPAEVRAGPVQDRRRLGSVPDPDRGSAAHEPAPRARSSTAVSCRCATRPTRRASAARPARTAPTCAG